MQVYQVAEGDSLFQIADEFGLDPITIILSNLDSIDGDPRNIVAGMSLYIPVVDGALYEWKAGDSLTSVAGKFHTDPDHIVMWAGNRLDYVKFYEEGELTIYPGALIFIPGGTRTIEATQIIPRAP